MSKKLLELMEAIRHLQEQHLEFTKKFWELKQAGAKGLDDMISVDELKRKYNISNRSYHRHKKEKGLRAYSFFGREYHFISDLITKIRLDANEDDPGAT